MPTLMCHNFWMGYQFVLNFSGWFYPIYTFHLQKFHQNLRWVMSQPFGLIEWPFQNWGPISVKNAPMRADLEWFPKLDPKQSCKGWIMITKVYEPQPQVWVTVLHLYTMEDFFFQKLTLANLIQLWCPVKFPKHSWRRYWETKMTVFGPRFR